MNYDHPNTSLNLSSSSRNNNNLINLDLVLVDSTSSPPTLAGPVEPPRVFSCNYCRRKFYSSQALGGHQNAHKLERTLAKKSRELSSVVRAHSVSSSNRQGMDPGRVNGSKIGLEDHAGRFGRREMMMNYGHDQEDHQFSQLDLSLKL